MPKFGENEFYKQCPICDGKIWGKGQKVLIEGAKIIVCESCAQYGKKIPSKPETSTSFQKKTYTRKITGTNKKPIKKEENLLETPYEIISNYATRIKNLRNEKNLTQEQFAKKLHEKESLIKRIEGGKVEPTIELAKKIEKLFNIQLFQQKDEPIVDYKHYLKKSTGSSLGDIAFIKKKK